MAETEFLQNEVRIWGEDTVLDLIDRGYTPTLTNHGWKWLLVRGQTAYTSKLGESYDYELR
jgi:hypothetical protein